MSEKDLEIIDGLILKYKSLPKVVDLRIKSMTESVDELEKEKLSKIYKDLDDLLNDTLAFINVKFPDRKDLKIKWNAIDFNPKIMGLKVNTNSQEVIRSNWQDGLYSLEGLLMNLKREVILRNETIVNSQSQNPNKKSDWKSYLPIASLIVAIIVMVFGNNLYEKFKSKQGIEDTKINASSIANNEDRFIDSIVLNHENHQIIDKGLYITNDYYDRLILSGANIDSIKINAIDERSEQLEMKIEEEGKELQFSLYYKPRIELVYKRKYYSIDIELQENQDFRNTEYLAIIKEVKVNSLNLKNWK